MKHLSLKHNILAAVIAGLSSTAFAGDDPAWPAQQQAIALEASALSAISSDRSSTINSLVSNWQATATGLGYSDSWVGDFTTGLEAASDQQLLSIQNANSYAEVKTILQGGDVSALPTDVEDISALGDLSADLVYTPVVPCRIFDTRSDGLPTPNGQNFQMHYFAANQDSVTDISNQGGNPLGCAEPLGRTEPSAIVANFTVIPHGKGHIRVYPYTAPQPTASFLNFNTPAGTNVANAGIITNCYLCGPEITVATYVSFGNSADSLADVMGYFYPAKVVLNRVAPTGSYSGSTTQLSTACTNYTSGSVTITAPSSGYITVTAQAWMKTSHAYLTATDAKVFIGESNTECLFSFPSQGYVAANHEIPSASPTGNYEWTMPISRIIPVTAGTYTYYLNGTGSADTVFWFASMQAHFSPM